LRPGEVARLLDAALGIKYKAALNVAYGIRGLWGRSARRRGGSLKVSDIDRKRMVPFASSRARALNRLREPACVGRANCDRMGFPAMYGRQMNAEGNGDAGGA
jgi:hypothetical protein